VSLGPPKVHAQEHLRPVLCLGAARTRLDVDVRIVGVHLAGKHAPELETFYAGLEALQVALDLGSGSRVAFFHGKREQFVRVLQSVRDLIEPGDDLLQLSPLLAKGLCPFRIIPDVRLFQFALDLDQPFRLLIVVKDTSSTRLCVR
jgi:hypothetical protein